MNKLALKAKVAPFAAALTNELAKVIESHVDELLDHARAAAVESIRAAVERQAAPKPRRAKRAESAAIASAPPAKTAAGPACSKCGGIGHNARSCGREPKGHRGSKLTEHARAAMERTAKSRAELDEGLGAED